MTTLVIDASVAAKWFLPATREPFANEALQLLKRYASGDVQFLVPDLFWAESANIFWKAVRQARWPRSAGEAAIHALKERDFPTVSSLTLVDDALALSLTFDRSVYDSLYVALALSAKTNLVTADERLANALAAHLPVKWLGSFA